MSAATTTPRLTGLQFEILQVLSGGHRGMAGLEDLCEEWTTPEELRLAVAALCDLGAVMQMNSALGTRYQLRGCSDIPRLNRVVRVKQRAKGPGRHHYRKCAGRIGLIEAITSSGLILRTGSARHAKVCVGFEEVEAP